MLTDEASQLFKLNLPLNPLVRAPRGELFGLMSLQVSLEQQVTRDEHGSWGEHEPWLPDRLAGFGPFVSNS